MSKPNESYGHWYDFGPGSEEANRRTRETLKHAQDEAVIVVRGPVVSMPDPPCPSGCPACAAKDAALAVADEIVGKLVRRRYVDVDTMIDRYYAAREKMR